MHRFLFVSFICFSFFCQAHLDGGFDRYSGPYVIDVGWSPTSPLTGKKTSFAINVIDRVQGVPANMSGVWVRFDESEAVSFAGTLSLTRGSTSFTYQFPSPGTWNITIRTPDGLEASGVVEVASSKDDSMHSLLALGVLLIVIVMAWFLQARRMR